MRKTPKTRAVDVADNLPTTLKGSHLSNVEFDDVRRCSWCCWKTCGWTPTGKPDPETATGSLMAVQLWEDDFRWFVSGFWAISEKYCEHKMLIFTLDQKVEMLKISLQFGIKPDSQPCQSFYNYTVGRQFIRKKLNDLPSEIWMRTFISM